MTEATTTNESGYSWGELMPLFERAVLARMTGSPNALTAAYHVTGSPGSAKSAFFRAVYDSVVDRVAEFHKVSPGDIPFVSLMCPLLDPMDPRGLPCTVTEGRKTHTVWARPGESIMPFEDRPAAFMFFDEVDKAPTATRNTLYQGLYERRFGEHQFPANTFCGVATNRVTDRAGGTTMESHGQNRLVHFDMRVDLDTTIQFFGAKNYEPWLLGFLKDFPEFLYKFNPKAKQPAYPTLRSWEFFAQQLALHGDSTMHMWGPGTVGDEAAAKAQAYFGLYATLPKWETLRAMKPENASGAIAKLPASAQYAAVSLMAANVKDVGDVDWMVETSEHISPDYAAMAFTWMTHTYKAKAPLAWKSTKARRFHADVGVKLHTN